MYYDAALSYEINGVKLSDEKCLASTGIHNKREAGGFGGLERGTVMDDVSVWDLDMPAGGPGWLVGRQAHRRYDALTQIAAVYYYLYKEATGDLDACV